MENKDVIIIGAGASGLMSACLLASSGMNILVIEKNTRIGRKLSATGNGRCNLTNLDMRWINYYGDKDWINSVIEKVPPQDVIERFNSLGVLTREKDGYVYPHTNQAMTVVSALEKGCDRENVDIHLEETVEEIIFNDDIGKDGIVDVNYRVLEEEKIIDNKNSIETNIKKFESNNKDNDNKNKNEYNNKNSNINDNNFEKPRFEVKTDRGVYGTEVLIMAAGGMAGSEQGGSGLGYDLIRDLGHTVTPIYPGLTGMEATGGWWKSVAGTRVQGSFTLFVDGISEGTHTGEIQITKTGVSGIPVFQLCRVAAKALDEGLPIWGEIDFVPSMNTDETLRWIENYGIEGLVPEKWIPVLLRPDGTPKALCNSLKHFSFTITDTYPIERAQVSAGGVPTSEVDPTTFASKLRTGLYILGELVDVDGMCGGYNLHLAWSSAILSSKDIFVRNGLTELP